MPYSCAVKHRHYMAPETKANERKGEGMGMFIAGFLTGIMACIVAMLVRCVLWYEQMHPEDDYWHRGTARRMPDGQEVLVAGEETDGGEV